MYSKRILKSSFLFLLFLSSTQATFAEGLTRLNQLKNVMAQQEKQAVVFRLEFQKPVGGYTKPVFFKKSIQVDFKNAFIKPAKRYFPTGDMLIPQVYVAQFSPNTVRVRFVLDKNGNDLRGNFNLRKRGKFLEARIENVESDVLEDLLKTIRERDKNIAEENADTLKPVTLAKSSSTQENCT